MKRFDSYKIFMILSFVSRMIFSLIFTVNLLYHVNTAKLDPLQLILVGTILEASIFIFEIPTGIIADTKSRRLSIIIGYIMMGAGFIIEGLFPHFCSIALAQVLWGIGYTFTSGATQAWISDEIGDEKAGKAFVKGAQAGQAGELIAIPASIGIGLISINLPIILGGVSMVLLAVFLYLFMCENGFKPKAGGETTNFRALLETVKTAKGYIRGNRIILLLLALGVFYGLYSEGFDRLWTAHFVENFTASVITADNPVMFVGVIRAVLIILSIAALGIMNRKLDLKKKTNVVTLLFISAAAIIASLIGFGLASGLYIAIALFLLIGVLRCITEPLLDTWLNSLIKDPNIRATLFSLRGQVDSLGQIAGGPVVGIFGRLFSIRIALLLSAVLLTPVLILYRLITRRGKCTPTG